MKFILNAQLKVLPPSNIRSIVSQLKRDLSAVTLNVNVPKNLSRTISGSSRALNNMAVSAAKVNVEMAKMVRYVNSLGQNSPALKAIVQALRGVNTAATGTSAAVSNVSRQARIATNDIEKFGAQAGLAIRRYGAFTLITSSFIQLNRAIDAAVKEAIRYDRELVRVAQVTGQSIKNLSSLDKEVTRLATTYGVASEKILESAVTLSQAGLSAKDTQTALEALAKTGVSATFGDITDTTEAAIAAMQQFGYQAKDLEGVLGSINRVSAAFAVESEDIAVAIRRAGGAFQAAGGNLNEFQALFTSVRQTTRESAETIATGFRTIFTRLQRLRTQNFLKTLGVDLLDEGQFVGPYEAIRRLSIALKDLEGTDPRFAQIIEELGGFRQISKVIPLIQQFSVSEKALSESLRGANSLTKDAVVAQQSLEIQITKLKEEFLAFVRAIASDNTIKELVKTTLNLASAFIKVSDSLRPLLPLILGVGALKAGAGFRQFSKGFKVAGFATGGNVNGVGSTDTVPAMLTPGEYVINKKSAQNIGKTTLDKLNKSGVKGFNKGGPVGFASGGLVGGNLGGIAAAAGLYGLIEGFSDTETELGKVTSQLVVLAGQLYITSRVFTQANKVVDKFKENQANRVKNTAAVGQRRLDFDLKRSRRNQIKDRAETLFLAGEMVTPTSTPQERADAYNEARQNVANRRDFLERRRNQRRADFIRNRSGIRGIAGRALTNPNIGAGLAVTGSVAGGYISSIAEKRINEGKDATQLAGIGGAVTGAATGAGIGAIFGPYGAAVGALAGAIYGYTTTITDAEEQLAKVKFDKEFEKITGQLSRVASGELSASGATTNVVRSLRNASELAGSGSADVRQNVLSQIGGQANQFESFFKNIASTSKTMKEFDLAVGESLLDFAGLAGIPYDQLRKSINDQIEAQNKATKFQNKQSEAYAQTIQRLAILNDTLAGIELASTNSAKNVGSRSLFGFATDSSNADIFDQALSGRANRARLNAASREVAGALGPTGTDQANRIDVLTDVIKQLPNVLINLRSQGGLEGEGQFTDKLRNEIDKITGGARDISSAIVTAAEGIIGADSKVENILREIDADLPGTVSKLTASVEDVFKVFKDSAVAIEAQQSRFQESLNKIIDSFSQLDQLNVDRFAARFEAADISNAITTRQPTPLSATLARRNFQVSTLSGGLSADPSVLGQAAADAANKIKDLDAQIANSINNEGLRTARAEEQLKLNRVNKALDTLARSTTGLSAIQEKLADAQDKLKPGRDLLETLAVGTNEEKIAAARNIQFAQIASAKGFEAIPESARRDVLDLFRQLGENINPATGETFNKTADRLTLASGTKAGVNADTATALITGISDEVKGLLTALQGEAQLRDSAFQQLYQNQNNLTQTFFQEEKAINAQFLTDLRSAIVESVRQRDEQQKQQDNKRAAEESNRASVRAQLQGGTVNGLKIFKNGGTVENLAGVIAEMQNLVNTRTELKGIQSGREAALKQLDTDVNNNLTEGEAGVLLTRLNSMIDTSSLTQTLNSGGFRADPIDGELNTGLSNWLGQFSPQDFKIAVQTAINEQFNDKFNVEFKGLEQATTNFNQTGASMDLLKGSIEELNATIKTLRGIQDTVSRNAGGHIPGSGTRDTVPAMLTPGEFVMRKAAVDSIGLDNLYRMNMGFATGGYVDDLEKIKDIKGRAKREDVGYGYTYRRPATDPSSPYDRYHEGVIKNRHRLFARNMSNYDLMRRNGRQQSAILASRMNPEDTARVRAATSSPYYQERLSQRGPGLLSGADASRRIMQRRAAIADKARRDRENKIASVSQRANALRSSSDSIYNPDVFFMPGTKTSDFKSRKATYDKIKAGRANFDAQIAAIKNQYPEIKTNAQARKQLRINARKQANTPSVPDFKNKRSGDFTRRFATGGPVTSSSRSNNIDNSAISKFDSAVRSFNETVNTLTNSLKAIGNLEINLKASHTVEVIINGADVLSKLQPEIQSMIVAETKKAMNSMIDNKFPGVGRVI